MNSKLLTLIFICLYLTSYSSVITVSNTNDSGAGSLRNAVSSSSNGDEIRFNPNLLNNGSDSIVLLSSISINKSLVIKGLQNATDTLYILGGHNDRIFLVNNATRLTLDSMVLLNGSPGASTVGQGSGGALYIYNSDSIFILNSILRNNLGALGGAIHFRSLGTTGSPNTYINISSSRIVGNLSISEGGGIYVETAFTSKVSIYKSLIKNNTAGSHGGGIYFDGFHPIQFTVDDSHIEKNNSGAFGGGAYLRASTDVVTQINISNFSDNTAIGNGGGLYSLSDYDSSFVTVLSSTIRGNTSGGKGGGICNQASKQANLYLENALIDSNTAITNGGGVYNYGINSGGVAAFYKLCIKNSSISYNSAGLNNGAGGGVYSSSYAHSASLAYIENSNVIGNSAKRQSGLIIGRADSLLINDSKIDSNYSSSNQTGGLYSDANFLRIGNSSISFNQGSGLNSQTQNFATDSLLIVNSVIQGNVGEGGIIAQMGSVIIDSSRIVLNSSINKAGGMDLFANSLEINNSHIDSNSTLADGGGISYEAKFFDLNNSTINGNTAAGNGGGVFFDKYSYLSSDTLALINVMNSSISDNTSGNNGGGMFTEIHSPSADYFGELDVVNSIIKGNVALNNGGGLYSFTGNFANGTPNPIFTTSNTNLNNSIVENNQAGNKGGGVYNYSQTGKVTAVNSKIRLNSADLGGGVYSASIGYGSGTDIINSTISENTALNSGGGIYSQCHLFVNSSTVSGNFASYGGGIFSFTQYASGIIDINTSTISENKALTGMGGGIYSVFYSSYTPTTINIMKSTITSNSAAIIGGGIYCSTGSGPLLYSLNIGNSIIALNGVSNLFNYQTPQFISNGYNIFSDTALVDTISTDQIAIDSTSLNLSSLTYNGGTTKTMIPLFPSVALNNGNPLDTTLAQNVRIAGIRDVGAAELCSSTYFIDSVTACNSYYLWIDGNTYFESNNVASYLMTNVAGCDSVVQLHLTLLHQSSIDTVNTCDSYFTWINGETYLSNNYSATDTLVNSVGCDSVVSLNLTITNRSSIDSVEVCESYYTWFNGVTYTSDNNTATDTLINSLGCDSVIYLDLTILHPSYVENIVACDSYTWVNGVTYTSNVNSVMDTISNSIGCDSVIILDLIINPSFLTTDSITACYSYSWIDGVIYYFSNNLATYIYNSVDNCDSTIVLDLTINNVDISVVKNGLVLTANATNANFQWVDCKTNLIINNETSAVFSVTKSGVYAVQVVQNNCVDTSICYGFINVDVNEIEPQSEIAIYPNPVTDQFTLELSNWTSSQIQVLILDGIGRVIETKLLQQVKDVVEVKFETSYLNAGMYFIQISDAVKTETRKLIIE